MNHSKKWRLKYPERAKKSFRKSNLKKNYGITEEDYNKLSEEQNGRCAICKELSNRSLCVDHDHVTGEIRGLLCSNCNTGIGMFRDNLLILTAALEYLK